ncbi:MAG: radical SAM-associated putative lipoprotein [Bacteroidales bacterium]|nr:radical SAM-associated putative lipoprotein [Bacteroidales bacterium]
MKQIKKYLRVKWCAMLSALLGLLGFAACGNKEDDEPCLYGQPYANFKVEGAVLNDDGKAVNEVKVYVRDHYGDTTKTDQDGKFVLNTNHIFPEKSFWLMAEDPSGIYQADSVEIVPKFEGGDNDWYSGSYSTTHNFTLKTKPAEPETPEENQESEVPENPKE